MFMCRLKGNRAFIWLRQNNLPLAEDNVKKKEKKKKKRELSFTGPFLHHSPRYSFSLHTS